MMKKIVVALVAGLLLVGASVAWADHTEEHTRWQEWCQHNPQICPLE